MRAKERQLDKDSRSCLGRYMINENERETSETKLLVENVEKEEAIPDVRSYTLSHTPSVVNTFTPRIHPIPHPHHPSQKPCREPYLASDTWRITDSTSRARWAEKGKRNETAWQSVGRARITLGSSAHPPLRLRVRSKRAAKPLVRRVL